MANHMALLKMVKSKLRREDLIPLTGKLAEMPEVIQQQFESFVARTGAKEDCFYYMADGTAPYVYYDFPYCHYLYSFDSDMEEMFSPVTQYEARNRAIDKAIEEKNYDYYLYIVEGAFDMLILQDLFDSLEGSEKYRLLKEKYTDVDYGHDLITREMWEEAILTRSPDDVSKIPGYFDTLTVYRGNSSQSTPPEQAMSWTVDFKVALGFATRLTGSEATIYEATIKRKDIIDYYDGRKEKEIICFPENLRKIKQITQEKTDVLLPQLNKERYADEYSYYVNTLMESEEAAASGLFPDSDFHNKLHTKRVLMLALTLSRFAKCSHTERAILANTAVYHDIGRTHEWEDEFHGLESVKKVNENNLPLVQIQCVRTKEDYKLATFSNEEVDIISFLMHYHCIEDTEAFSALSKRDMSEKGKKTARKLYKLFKDADGLDRVRLGDLDISYLRTPKAKELIVFATDLLRNIE